MLTYILQVAFFQFLFLGVYVILLRKETFFNYNRLYLLVSSALALLLPFIKINVFARIVPESLLVNLPTVLLGTSNTSDTITPQTNILGEVFSSIFEFNYTYVWAFGAMITLMILGYKFYKMYSLKQLNKVVEADNCTIITLANSNDAFSFFKTIYIGDQLTSEAQKTILIHEKAHIKQFHSLDLLWFEFLRIVFWFNPLVYVYQQQITETHEFIADQSAGKKQQNYYESLLAKTFGIQQFTFVNQFYSSSLIKKRIIMLTRKQSSKKQLIKYLSIIPLVVGMLVIASCNTATEENLEENKVVETQTQEAHYNSKEVVPFMGLDRSPIFPGCDANDSKEDLKKCFTQSITKFVVENFDTKSAEELGLTGRQKILVMFTIDNVGNITEVKARAPHITLTAEAIRVINALPQMKPGEHNGKAVNVPYSLPIIFAIN